jgi:hypothetical protein
MYAHFLEKRLKKSDERVCFIVSYVPFERLRGEFLFIFIFSLNAAQCLLRFITVEKAYKASNDSFH